MNDLKGKTINLFLTGCLRDLLFSLSNLQSLKRSDNFNKKSKNSTERENRNDDVIKNAGTSRSFVEGSDITIRDDSNNTNIGNKDTNTNSNTIKNTNRKTNISNEHMAFSNINIASTISSSSSVSYFDTFSSSSTDICDNITCVVFDCHLLMESNPIAEMKCKYIRIRSLPLSFHLFYFNL